MDLRAYYQKIRKIEAEIPAESAVMVSLETAEGGTAGRMTEARRPLAARLIAEGRARLANEEEADEFRRAQTIQYQNMLQREAGAQGGMISEQDLQAIRRALQPGQQG